MLDHWDRVGDWTQQWLNLRYAARLLVRVGADAEAAALHHSLVAQGKPSPLADAGPAAILDGPHCVTLARRVLTRLAQGGAEPD